jgi:hypothetical protein
MATTPCIFCQTTTKMTNEHVWGDWIKDHVERRANKHGHAYVLKPRPGEPDEVVVRTRAGDHIDAKVKIVCADCNSGWMSRLQETAKPFLIPLFKGENWSINQTAQSIIAAWIAMATTTGEHISAEKKRVSIPQADHDHLMKTQTASLDWCIWIGRFERTDWPGQWIHTTVPILDAEDFSDFVPNDPRATKLQATVFTIGQLYVFAMSCPIPGIANGWDWRTAPAALTKMVKIWPTQRHPDITWPLPSLTDREADTFATAVERYFYDLAMRKGYR